MAGYIYDDINVNGDPSRSALLCDFYRAMHYATARVILSVCLSVLRRLCIVITEVDAHQK